MLFATVKTKVKPYKKYLVETEDVKKCVAEVIEINREFDSFKNYFTEVFQYTFLKDNGFTFVITERTRDVVIEEVEG